ncbi:uncharacterized protein PV07_08856 [Cladophialophora immunda]|uniref:Zn(2)-C6 fungal-type domain-containing protein n=1 Tax=Cladophialophora immunda TaxID=569365 RepID=A0A0D2C5E0_9EURO|nr:uncharacterized protein PV07_08856 [Cladophialophora immunda]KIW25695.1 hypothetical protein PV07_08856 [Cladophialophora immunda]OQU96322.1 Fungal Zn2-Cys6 binuclear cluster domain-containing protein [Cladophialophora immunda]
MQPRRAGHEKSKNGCLTCRIRRVKCDESIPYCQRCTQTGRKCEGPVVREIRFVQNKPASQSSTPSPPRAVSLLAPQHTVDERRAWHYFLYGAAPAFAGTVEATFWQDQVPRLAHMFDFVWDTVVCLSSLSEHVPYVPPTAASDPRGLTKPANRKHRQALRYYHKAIVSVRRLAERGQIDDSIVALSYILFASVEYHHRNVTVAKDLMKRCSRILTDNLRSLDSRPSSTAGQAVHQMVASFVLKKVIVGATIGSGLSSRLSVDDETGDVFGTAQSRSPLLEARVQFDRLMNQSYEVIRHADFLPHVDDEEPLKIQFLSRRLSLLDDLLRWKTAFTANTGSQTPDLENDMMTSYLLMYWAVCYVSVGACLSPHQTVYDTCMDHFADIVEQATFCLRQAAQYPKAQRLLSTFDPGLIPPLYFCATKCRDPTLRRAALCLMRQAPEEDNSWVFVEPDRVVAKVISIEEGECQLSCSTDLPQSHYASLLPPEERRFAYVSVVGRETPTGKRRQALELSRFEYAVDGSRRLVHEYAWLDDVQEG